jgi:hypothetical protein
MNCYDFQLLNLNITVSASINIDYGSEVYQITGSQTSFAVTSREDLGKRIAACGAPETPISSSTPIMAKRGTCGLSRYVVNTNVYSVAGQMYGGFQGDEPQQIISAQTGNRIELPWRIYPEIQFGHKAPAILFNESQRAKNVYKHQSGCELNPNPDACKLGIRFPNIYYPEEVNAIAVFPNSFLIVGNNSTTEIVAYSGAATASGSCTVTITCNQL